MIIATVRHLRREDKGRHIIILKPARRRLPPAFHVFVPQNGAQPAKDEKMSARAANFVEDWISENVPVGQAPINYVEVNAGREDGRAREYAERCMAAAVEAGIPEKEIADEYRSLVVKMHHAIDVRANEKPAALGAEDDD